MKNLLFSGLLALALFSGSIGCKKDGPAESTGKQIDNAIDNLKKGEISLATKGPGEKLGESIDKAVDDVKESVK